MEEGIFIYVFEENKERGRQIQQRLQNRRVCVCIANDLETLHNYYENDELEPDFLIVDCGVNALIESELLNVIKNFRQKFPEVGIYAYGEKEYWSAMEEAGANSTNLVLDDNELDCIAAVAKSFAMS